MAEEFRPVLLEDIAITWPGFVLRRMALNRHMPRVEKFGEHVHDHSQVLLYLGGRGVQRVGDSDLAVGRGTALRIPPGVPHRFRRERRLRPVCLAVDFDGGDLEKVYDRLNREFEKSVADADAVRERIDEVEDVAQDLFKEWEKELDDYSSARLRSESRNMMNDTRQRYSQLMAAMRRAEATMDPVLEAFEDQVLVLKHNLNARAIGALRGELASIERDTERLVAEMQQSIQEADSFIASME